MKITLQNNKPALHEQILSLNSALDCGRVCHSGGVALDYGKWTDLQMLVCVGGRERTETEYRTLLAGAGFALQEVLGTDSPLSLLVATPR